MLNCPPSHTTNMHQNIYVIYKDDHTDVSHINDLTHANLINNGYKVIHSEAGYTSTRVEYQK